MKVTLDKAPLEIMSKKVEKYADLISNDRGSIEQYFEILFLIYSELFKNWALQATYIMME